MAPEPSIADLVQRLRAGDAAAADQLFARRMLNLLQDRFAADAG